VNIPNIAELSQIGCMFSSIPHDVFEQLKVESNMLESNNQLLTSGLTNKNVSTHYFFNQDSNFEKFRQFINNEVHRYVNIYPSYLNEFSYFTNNVPVVLGKPWFNIQKAGEFLPNHIHDGLLSYSGWIKVPYTLEDKSSVTSCFQFTYPWMSKLRNISLPVDQSFEGMMIVFPSSLMHCVYPFYNNDETRISFSGNLMFDTTESKV